MPTYFVGDQFVWVHNGSCDTEFFKATRTDKDAFGNSKAYSEIHKEISGAMKHFHDDSNHFFHVFLANQPLILKLYRRKAIMNMPSWYWENGLHDAQITDIQFEEFDFDYSQHNPIRNCITIKLDAQMAMFDTTLKEIKLMNAKFIHGDTQCVNWFWKDDIIKETNKGYELEITLISHRKIKKCKIGFENAIIER